MHVYMYMGVMRRNKDGVDALEHAVQGIHTSNDHSLVRYARERGLIGASSAAEDGVRDDNTSEREVIVKVRRSSSRSWSRRRKT